MQFDTHTVSEGATMTRRINVVIGTALAIGFMGCNEPSVECGAQCPDISGTY